jgi:hypothetical protein
VKYKKFQVETQKKDFNYFCSKLFHQPILAKGTTFTLLADTKKFPLTIPLLSPLQTRIPSSALQGNLRQSSPI